MTTQMVSAHRGHQLVLRLAVSLGPFPTLFVVFFSGLEAKKKCKSFALQWRFAELGCKRIFLEASFLASQDSLLSGQGFAMSRLSRLLRATLLRLCKAVTS